MPLYEYECPKCGRFEVLQKMSDAPLATHEKCGSPVKKILSAGNFAFKGSGFYITDYKKGASCDKPKSESCSGCPGHKAA